MASTAIETWLRVRPAKDDAGYFGLEGAENGKVDVNVPEDRAAGMVNNRRTHWRFSFNGVLDPRSTQEEVFDKVAVPVIDSVFEGYNGTIFAYGQTGSGKTYTLTGGVEAYAQRGLIPRTLQALFARVEADTEAEHTVRVSYLEIYNDAGFDLLDPRQAAADGRPGELLTGAGGLGELARVAGVVEDDDGNVRLKGLSSHVVRDQETALNLLFVGDTNRAVSETVMNATSSRSHCIFTISVESRPHGASMVRRSKLHLVDLAGSERVGKSGTSGTTLNEAININSSLHFLELVIMSLHENQKKQKASGHVPYRNSMLTSVLRDSLGGNCRTVMVANVHPSPSHVDESISTCRFAQRVAMVRNEVSVNEEVDQSVLIARLREENALLREGRELDDGAASLTAEELGALHSDVRAFVAAAEATATVAWGKGKRAAKVRHAMWILKGLLLEGWRPAHAPSADAWVEGGAALVAAPDERGDDAAGDAGADDGAGAERAAEGPARDADAARGQRQRHQLLERVDGREASDAEVLALQSAELAFALFTSAYAHGVALAARAREAKEALRARVEEAQALGADLHESRDAIKAAKGKVEAVRISLAVASVLPPDATGEADGEDGAGGAVADAEELRLVSELQAEKERYRARADELKSLKSQCTALQARCATMQSACEAAFRQWWPLACAAHGVEAEGEVAAGCGGASRPDGEAMSATASAAREAEAAPPRRPRAAWGEARDEAAPAASDARAAPGVDGARVAMLNDAEAALAEFRSHHWDGEKARARDALKHRLSEAYAAAKEAGELVGRKRASLAHLKRGVAEAEAEGGEGEAALEQLRSQLALDTTLYKGGVAQLRELKAEIEAMQRALQESQAAMHDEFERWRGQALAEAEGRAGEGARRRDGPSKARRGNGRAAVMPIVDLEVEVGEPKDQPAPPRAFRDRTNAVDVL